MVDWSLARQVARIAARPEPVASMSAELPAYADDAERRVGDYTGLEPDGPTPPAEAVGRGEWVDANLDTLASYLEPVAGRLDGRLGSAGPLAGALRAATGATLAAEAGLVMGYMATRVLGQYELSLLQPESRPRLLFVEQNLENAVAELRVDREAFLRWVALHEVTHAFQFAGVPWLRDHLGGLLRQYLETVDVRIDRGSAGGLPSLPDPRRLVDAFREGGLAALVQTREQRGLLARVQAAMAVVEGYAEHVMDAVAGPDIEPLRAAMERRRSSRSAPERALMRLLGFDIKMRQYEDGKRFCDAVAAEGGIGLLNGVWRSAEALPTPAELADPASWPARVAA
ncbi:MAG TPA: zinc-dependent metalloprotease [Thermoleophilaceae bacterium]|nr:zinc-dependent metalloprotease [Thermoleophilaceae bacterium]